MSWTSRAMPSGRVRPTHRDVFTDGPGVTGFDVVRRARSLVSQWSRDTDRASLLSTLCAWWKCLSPFVQTIIAGASRVRWNGIARDPGARSRDDCRARSRSGRRVLAV